MGETNNGVSPAVEKFMRSLAEQIAHQMGRKVEDFKVWIDSEEKPKEETA